MSLNKKPKRQLPANLRLNDGFCFLLGPLKFEAAFIIIEMPPIYLRRRTFKWPRDSC